MAIYESLCVEIRVILREFQVSRSVFKFDRNYDYRRLGVRGSRTRVISHNLRFLGNLLQSLNLKLGLITV